MQPRLRLAALVLGLGLLLPLAIPALGAPPVPVRDHVVTALRFKYTPAEMKAQCAGVLSRAQKEIERLATIPDARRTFENTVLAFERIRTRVDDWLGPVDLLTAVASDKAVQGAAGECGESVNAFFARVLVRPDLYRAMTVVSKKSRLEGEDARLMQETLRGFKRSGAALTASQRAEVTRLKDELSHLETEFSRVLAQADDTIELTEEDLVGLSPDFIAMLKKNDNGTWRLTLLDVSQFVPFMENARSPSARQKVMAAKERVAASVNVPMLEKAIALRGRIARIMGYSSHAAFVLDNRMAKTPERVRTFLDGLARRLTPRAKKELAELLVLKQKDEPDAKAIEAWDIAYYLNQMKKQKYLVDAESVREYFPVDHVLKAVFEIYQALLGVRFTELKEGSPESNALGGRWAPGLRLFVVRDAKSNARLSYFYLDLFPRENKYKHFAAFTLCPGRLNPDGSYQAPVAGIVGNFPPPSAERPALLRHNDVETFFHEFGHVMHKVLTQARYASLSGSRVRRDFVEAPSQMLENWVWNEAMLARLSSHYKTGSPLPRDLLKKMLAARHAADGIFYTRQLMFALVDLDYHTRGEKVDTTAIWNARRRQITLVNPLPGSQPQATFGHLMGGYDAGYYGYLWSKVFAEDMFTVFERFGLTSPKAGLRYRSWILARGDTEDPDVLLKGFLGRPPDPKAFYKSLGL